MRNRKTNKKLKCQEVKKERRRRKNCVFLAKTFVPLSTIYTQPPPPKKKILNIADRSWCCFLYCFQLSKAKDRFSKDEGGCCHFCIDIYSFSFFFSFLFCGFFHFCVYRISIGSVVSGTLATGI